MEEEIWKPVVGFEQAYEVSSIGRVRSLFFNGIYKRNTPKILTLLPTHHGYVRVALFKDGKPKFKTVHSILLEAFKEKRPVGKIARHLDGVRTNNFLHNLEWGTHSENAQDAMRHGTFVIGEKNGMAVLTKDKVIAIRKLRDSGLTCPSIASTFGIHPSLVSLIGLRQIWKHVGESP